MKNTIALSLLALPFLFAFTGDPETDRKSPPTFYIEYCKPDASIKKNEARIQFSFRSNYYGVVKDSVLMSFNGISRKLKCDSLGHASLVLAPGKYKFQFWLNNRHEEIYTDSLEIKAAHITGIAVYFSSTEYFLEADKPVIYFYPEVTTEVQVRLNVQGHLGFTYPAYNNGWNFSANPDGKIHAEGKEYEYLFWDAKIPQKQFNNTLASGFFVNRDSLIPFFEQKLTAMGLNAREQQDFITYWCPLMQKNETSFVHFMFTEEYDSIATINITPKPDHLFRVFMVWRDADQYDYTSVSPQVIPRVTREGFTVIEWGGGEISQRNAVGCAQ